MISLESMLILSTSICIRSMLGVHPHSGEGTPPMYGDYEAQRHWQEITVNLPFKDWYFNTTDNDLMYWGLDYPPLTAYHSLAIGKFAREILLRPEFVELHSSRGLETPEHKFFMRCTVFLADLLIFLPSTLFFVASVYCQNSPKTKFNAIVLTLYPGLILIDNGHFQYNDVSLGLFIFAVGCLWKSWDCIGSILFVLALSYKQMELYHALPFFFYLLGKSLFESSSSFKAVLKLTGLAFSVLGTFTIIWLPFIQDVKVLKQVIRRIFPLARGIFEDKVANFWCSLNVFIKLKKSFSSEELAMICLATTAVSVLPSNLHLFFRPSRPTFLMALITTSLNFFLFSFQVHEKSILLAAIPVAMYFSSFYHTRNSKLICLWFLTISTFSMFPLFHRDGLSIPSVSLSVLYITVLRHIFDLTDFVVPRPVKKNRIQPIDGRSKLDLLVLVLYYLSISGCVVLVICLSFVPPPKNYPDIWPLLISVYSAAHFAAFQLYFHYLQFYVVNPTKSVKLKIH